MTTHLHRRSPSRRERGISLIEILIGVTIGVIGILAIFQTVAVWNRHTQTTTSGGDAQIAGALAMFNLERDLKQAGHGFSRAPLQVMGSMVAANGVPAFALQPVTITVGAGGASDTIVTLHGDSSYFVDSENFTAATTSAKTLRRRGGFHPGDLAVVAGNWAVLPSTALCELVEITGDANIDGRTVDHQPVTYTSFYSPAPLPARFNPPGGSNPAFVSGDVYNLGPRPQLNTWTVQNNRYLTRAEAFAGAPGLQIADGVVQLRAEYGFDLNGNGQIDPGEWTNAPPPPVDWTRLLAVRVAVLVRGRQFERHGDPGATGTAAVTTAVPAWAGGTFVMTNVDGTADSFGPTDVDPNNWRFYRYRVYERVIPLRNMLWGRFG